MTSKQFKVGDKVKRVEDMCKYWKASSGEAVTITGIDHDGYLIFDEEDGEGTWYPGYFELVESAEDTQEKEEPMQNTDVPQGQEVTLSFKGDSLKVNLKATNPEGYCCNEDDLLLAMQKIMQIAKNWNTFSLTITSEDSH